MDLRFRFNRITAWMLAPLDSHFQQVRKKYSFLLEFDILISMNNLYTFIVMAVVNVALKYT